MELTASLQGFLGQVEHAIIAHLGGEKPDPAETLVIAARHLCLNSGKRARPLLVKIFGDTLGVPDAKLLAPALAAEMIHAASLLHDDVIDAGMFRRGKPTVNARWGNVVSVMSGDLLLSTALLKLAEADATLARTGLATVAEMTQAAIREVQARGNLETTIDDLRGIWSGKTGSLFAWCGVAAATIAKNDEAAARFSAFGRKLGIAFQMADDIRDVTGTDEGKPQYADLQSRTPSLPVIIATQGDSKLRRKIAEAWQYSALSPDKVRELGTAVVVSGAVESAIAMMNTELDAAVEALGPYANTESGINLITWARMLAKGMTLKGAA